MTARNNRQRLIEALRAPMPTGFEWDFRIVYDKTDCGTAGCAIGLACELWPDEKLDTATTGGLANFFDLPRASDAFWTFQTAAGYNVPSHLMKDVTPQMVADKLERFP